MKNRIDLGASRLITTGNPEMDVRVRKSYHRLQAAIHHRNRDTMELTIPSAAFEKVALAVQQNTRVMVARNPETHALLDIAKNLEAARGAAIRQGGWSDGTRPNDVPVEKKREIVRSVISQTRAVAELSILSGRQTPEKFIGGVERNMGLPAGHIATLARQIPETTQTGYVVFVGNSDGGVITLNVSDNETIRQAIRTLEFSLAERESDEQTTTATKAVGV
ncbi:MAG TPA: hypothetical protein VGK27_06775 [Candidatus Deferrimicrobiaceae bacterium]